MENQDNKFSSVVNGINYLYFFSEQPNLIGIVSPFNAVVDFNNLINILIFFEEDISPSVQETRNIGIFALISIILRDTEKINKLTL